MSESVREATLAEAPVAVADPIRPFHVIRRKIVRGSAWVMGGKVTTTVLGFLINALLARMLSPRELGAYFSAYTLVVVGSIIAQFGLDRAVVRFVSSALGTGRTGQARHVIRTVFSFGAVGTAAVASLLLAGGGYLAHHVLGSELVASVIPVTVGWLAATAMQSLLVETFRALQRFDLSTVLDALLVDVLAASVFGAVFLLGGHLSLSQVLWVLAGFTVTMALVATGLLIGPVRRLKGDDRASSREVLSMAWPVVITNTASYLLGTGIDLWVLGAFQPQQRVAVYGAAARLILLVNTPYLILQGVTPPVIAELYAQGRKRELERVLRAVSTLAALPAVTMLLVFAVAGHSVMGLAFGPFYRQGGTILAILSIGRVVSVWTGSCGVTLLMTGHHRQMMHITVLTGLASVGGGIVMAPHFGGLGVAISTASVACIQNCLQLAFARRLTGMWTQAYLSPRPLWRFLRRGPQYAKTNSGCTSEAR